MEIKKLHQKFKTLAERDYKSRTPAMNPYAYWTNRNSMNFNEE